ncbi:hypothetical protein AYO21_06955 [Fonsecaea monophora]|uniref:Epoxide hydrolase N-terminal domain-containing protein n=1 Tax=Fonsecaea monophora TaxID=254056 RepID=A0A177F596_9EURO|nr:hypothetical protein AYO21_06955 [Fonsecaea monophora]OAG38760.1 hypothetical protein AYO21_06955 [Fonsecaea monophora]
MASSIQPYKITVSGTRIQELNSKLDSATHPDELDSAGWDMGVPLSDIQRLTKYWRHEFSWRRAEEKLNELPHFVTTIACEGYEPLNIHFLHKRSLAKGAIPLLFVHGWPGNFLEVTKIIDGLSTPTQGQVSFHVVAPSLPNFGFSEGTRRRGFSVEQHAETLHKLMERLGYDQYVTQGGDWGYYITRAISALYPSHCRATHFNMDVGTRPTLFTHPLLFVTSLFRHLSNREQQGVSRTEWFDKEGFGYNLLQSTKPQTIGYALADSPVALLAWIYEKLHDWADARRRNLHLAEHILLQHRRPRRLVPDILRNGPFGPLGSSLHPGRTQAYQANGVKIGISHFPRDINVLPSSWTRTVGEVVFEKEHDKGGHFAAWERPEDIVRDVREMFGRGGGAYGVVEGRDGY